MSQRRSPWASSSRPRSSRSSFSGPTSEVLFVPLCLGALIVLASYLVDDRTSLAVAFVLLAGAASFTRFLGLALAGTAIILIATRNRRPLAARLSRAAIIGVLAASPGIVWQLWKTATSATGGAGVFAVHLPTDVGPKSKAILAGWVNGRLLFFTSLDHIADWPTLLVGIGLVVLVVAGLVLARPRADGADTEDGDEADDAPRRFSTELTLVVFLFAALYLALLWITVAFFVRMTPFANERMWLPVLPGVLIVVVSALWNLGRNAWRRGIGPRVLVGLAIVVVAAPICVWHIDSASSAYRRARSLAPIRPAPFADLYRRIEKLPAGALVFTGDAYSVWYETGHFAASLPIRKSPWTGKPNPDYRTELGELAPVLCRHPGIIAYLRRTDGPGYPSFAELRRAHIIPDQQFTGAQTFRVDPAAC